MHSYHERMCNCLKMKYIYFLLSTVACLISTPLHLRAKDLIQARSTLIKFALCKFVDLITEELWEQCPAIHLLLAEAGYHMLQRKAQETLCRLVGNSLFREKALISSEDGLYPEAQEAFDSN